MLEERLAELQNDNDLLHRQIALLRASEAAFQSEAKVVSGGAPRGAHRLLPAQAGPSCAAPGPAVSALARQPARRQRAAAPLPRSCATS
jgi:hypothetical protein